MYNVLAYILMGISYFLDLLGWAIVINALLSWFLPQTNSLRSMLDTLLSPFLGPFRALTQRMMRNSSFPIDLSPILAYVAIMILNQGLGWVINQTMAVSRFY